MENKNNIDIGVEDIQYRVGQVFYDKNKKVIRGVSLLIYIDARTAEDQLDKKFEPENWAFKWEKVENNKWAVKGIMTVKMSKEGGWIVREDVGYPQENKKKKSYTDKTDTDVIDSSEWLKDAVSDALKRCAVQFGIGRFLYDAPFLYAGNLDKSGVAKKEPEIEVTNYDGKESFRKLTKIGEEKIKKEIKEWYDSVVTPAPKAEVK